MGDAARAEARLSEELSGVVFLPGTAAYDEARVSFNGMIDRRPALIARCLSVDDVVLAVRCAVEVDLPISIRGGGHSVAGHGIGDDAMMIDLREMREISVEELRLARTTNANPT